VRESTTLSQNKKRPLKDISGHVQESTTGKKQMKTLDSFFGKKTDPKKAVGKKEVVSLKVKMNK
jgi:hypothetical protein